jgi:hypothetical protein
VMCFLCSRSDCFCTFVRGDRGDTKNENSLLVFLLLLVKGYLVLYEKLFFKYGFVKHTNYYKMF